MILIKELTEEKLKLIKETLDNDGIIIFPTDTVYGIGCNCYSEKALKKLFSFKNRPLSKPINVLTDSITKIELVSQNISEKERELINKYLPGDLTIILDKKENVPDLLTANLKTIGVRIPNHKVALEILKEYPYPLATTSVNLSGESPGIEVEDFIEEFKDKVDIIVDGGKSPIGVASTIVRIENNKINILREGNLKVE
ncbi:MAG: threonylcarbamoyl-AMP synthase [Bacilli bacterium]|nr:threonylcarbamoyl-AMP synthase [Bacilli bacterium]